MNIIMIFLYGVLLEFSALLVYMLLDKRKKKLNKVLAFLCYLGALILSSIVFITIIYLVELNNPNLLSIIEL